MTEEGGENVFNLIGTVSRDPLSHLKEQFHEIPLTIFKGTVSRDPGLSYINHKYNVSIFSKHVPISRKT